MSAPTADELRDQRSRLADHLAAGGQSALSAAARSAGPPWHRHRLAVVAHTVDHAVTTLRSADGGIAGVVDAAPRVVLLFSGQGAQYGGMGAALYREVASFRGYVDTCAELLASPLGLDLRELLLTDGPGRAEADRRLTETLLTQPAMFTVDYALARLWIDLGVRPVALLGHSIGEYVAATVAGVFALPDALSLIAARGRLMQELPRGSMLGVALDEADLVERLPPELSLSAVNGARTCVVSGPSEAIDRFAEQLRADWVAAKRLRTSHAFHSALMDPAVGPFTELVAGYPRRAARIPVLSNRTGQLLTAAEAVDPAYWAAHLREPVRFGAGLATILASGPALFLECGPGRQLTGLVRMLASDADVPALASLPSAGDRAGDVDVLLATAARMWVRGVDLALPRPD